MPFKTNRPNARFQAPSVAKKSVVDWDDLPARQIDLIQKELRKALKNPVNFPPIETAIIPDDTVCLAIEPALPQLTTVVIELVDYLLDHGVLLKNITVLAGDAPSLEVIESAISPPSRLAGLRLCSHDPSNEEDLCYLAAAKNGSPIALNRELVDADVVIPVCLAKGDPRQWESKIEFLYPNLSDALTIERFKSQTIEVAYNRAKTHPNLVEAQEAMRWLGVNLNLMIEPGPGDSILRFAAGERQQAIDDASQSSRAAWHRAIDQTCDLVVAAADIANEPRTWDELQATIRRFSTVLSTDGAIVVSARFGKGSFSDDDDERLENSPTMSRAVRSQFETMLASFHIYLISDLSREATEDLGFGFIRTGEEIERLSQAFERCLYVSDSNRCSVSLGKGRGKSAGPRDSKTRSASRKESNSNV